MGAAREGEQALGRQLETLHRALDARLAEAGLDALRSRLAPPTRPQPGYGILPEIGDDGAPGPVPLTPRRYSLAWLGPTLEEARSQAGALAAALESADPSQLPSLLERYEALRARHRQLREHVRYHELWQADVARRPETYEARRPLAGLARRLEHASRGGDPVEREALRREILDAVAPFRPTTGLAVRTAGGGEGELVLPVPLATDITDAAFLERFEVGVERVFNASRAARSQRFRLDVRWRRFPPETLYPEMPPATGEAVDESAHLSRFPDDALVVTTGARSTHAYVGRALLLGPERVTPRVLAHELCHLLGFSDAYLRHAEGHPGDPAGVVLVEWVGLRDDLMGSPGRGEVSRAMIERLLEAYGPFRSAE